MTKVKDRTKLIKFRQKIWNKHIQNAVIAGLIIALITGTVGLVYSKFENSYSENPGSTNNQQDTSVIEKEDTAKVIKKEDNIEQIEKYSVYINSFGREEDVIYKNIRYALSEKKIDIVDNLEIANYELELKISITDVYTNLEINLKNRMTNKNEVYSYIDGKKHDITDYEVPPGLAKTKTFYSPIFEKEILKKVLPKIK